MEQNNTNLNNLDISDDVIDELLDQLSSANPDDGKVNEILNNVLGDIANDEEKIQSLQKGIETEMSKAFEKLDPERRIKVAKGLLEEKYGKEFEILRYRGDRFPEEYYSVDAYEKKHPSIIFEALIDEDDEGIQDSFSVKMICELLRKRIMNNMDFYPGEMDIMVFSEKLISSLNEYDIDLKDIDKLLPNNKYAIHIFLDNEERPQYNEIKRLLYGLNNIDGSINFFRVDKAKKNDLFAYINQRAKLYSSYWELAGDSYLGCVQFEAGELRIDETAFENLF